MELNIYLHRILRSYLDSNKIVCGVDEVGRGSICGPLYACAITFDRYWFDSRIDDSKKLAKKTIEELSRVIKENCLEWSLGIVSASELNKIQNIHKASLLAMRRAILSLKTKPDIVFVDGPWNLDVDVLVYPVVGGDACVFPIACASIVAKFERDSFMKRLAKRYPQYGFETNVGYRSRKHFEAIKKYGVTPYHRLWLIKEYLNEV